MTGATNFAPRPAEITVTEISKMLAERMRSVCDGLGLNGAVVQGLMTPLNPTRNDRNPGSFVIHIEGQKRGRWDEYATGEFGDAVDLIAYVQFGRIDRTSKAEALRWAKRFLGVGDHRHMDPAASKKLEAARREMEARTAQAQRLADERLEKQRRGANAMFLGADVLAPGTPGWDYLTRVRRIPLETLPRLPYAVRSHPAMKHKESGLTVPALTSGFIFPNGMMPAVHRVFLDPADHGKLRHSPAKKIFPSGWLGAVIPISRGKTGLAPRIAFERGLSDECVYAEGVEDAFTGAVLNPDWRVSAVGAARNFAMIEPPECAGKVIVMRDRDPDRKVRAAVDRHVHALRQKCEARGVAFFETWPDRDFKDFNAMLMGTPS